MESYKNSIHVICLCNSEKVCFHSFNLLRLLEQPLTAHELLPPFLYFTSLASNINTRNNTPKNRCENKRQLMFTIEY